MASQNMDYWFLKASQEDKSMNQKACKTGKRKMSLKFYFQNLLNENIYPLKKRERHSPPHFTLKTKDV